MRLVPARLFAFLVAFFVAMSLLAPDLALAQAARKSVTQLTAAELMSLRRGVATMMARNSAPRTSADFRRSWIYWANMHGHFGTDCRGPITGAGMAGVTVWTASNSAETATWCKCEHGTDQFLTWHRMYLYYFERVLQQASGDPNLRLPYWDYGTDPVLPAAFRATTYVNQAGQTVPNPLRVTARRAALNSGTSGLAASTTSTSNAMAATNFSTFRARLESAPHGAVHCSIASGGCPTGLMGAVPAAALDPIFYLHHANIDRLYECWLRVNPSGRLPTSAAILDKTYSFIDADGALKQRRVRDMLTLSQLGYSYTAGSGCPGAPAVAANTEVAQMSPTELGRGVTSVPLTMEGAPAAAQGAPEGTSRKAAPGTAARPATVVIDGLEATEVPGVLFNVYLGNRAGERALIGVIDFFGFDGGGTGGGGMGGTSGAHAGHGDHGRRFEFDATAAVAALGLSSTRKPELIFEPTTGLDDSTVAQAMASVPAETKVTFRRAWLRVD
ncbi:MAG: tyrosinase family protein [Amaricoccus sp.]|uniref:tyrosinase family protein n=1 Tax=Amaricoccus sp. TaxID=1872485 RepID=UPI003315061F